jgi:CdiI immunity protein
MTPQDSYPYLSQMFGAYFHQDWDLEGNDWPDLVENYIADEVYDPMKTAEEIDRLLSDVTHDSDLERTLFAGLGSYYIPRRDLDGPTIREWLGQIAMLLRQRGGRSNE